MAGDAKATPQSDANVQTHSQGAKVQGQVCYPINLLEAEQTAFRDPLATPTMWKRRFGCVA
jgi:hypothetical protein